MRRKRLFVSGFAAAILAVGGSATWAFGLGGRAPLVAASSAHGDDELPRDCAYPPTRYPTLVISGPSKAIAKNRKFDLPGRLRIKHCGRRGVTVGLYSSPSISGPFTPLHRQETTDRAGEFTFKDLAVAVTTYYQAASTPTVRYAPAVSNVVTVAVKP
jgi:hypothetical protein